ncbi:helix-turn-helix domain-containing protein [Macrococcoides canis]|uniref:Helix-turn-helix domain-containing protein n=1 Tax=Macrococcoides canis TaxID=1855823 RepID=A0AAE6X2M8_9STAP|nr:helix-turn-helix domain-containing protein [Macrococcus canis]QNR07916.1 helix-turn-helix domain-containing protein [Macrococcus canis]
MGKINFVVSQNLMLIRKEQQLSLEKLASITSVSRAMLNQIEKGQSNPTISTLRKISNGLKCHYLNFYMNPFFRRL